ncbi:hypothetical protein JX266_006654 [Neoarthrinium moseri]|nr:hypothetical protein JX266_006654 [Neoarthrinium moseri]
MADTQDVEILVHIAAPSTALDDARYRSLASAYVNFSPHKRRKLTEPVTGDPNHEPSSPVPVSEDVRTSGDSRPEGPQGTQVSVGPLPSLRSPLASFRSVLDNADSPLRIGKEKFNTINAPRFAIQGVATSQSSWKTPPSVVQDSVPDNDATAAMLTTPTRVLEHYLQNFHSPSQASLATSRPTSTPQKIQGSQKTASQVGSSDKSSQSRGLPTIPCTPGNRPPPVSSTELGKPSTKDPMSQDPHRSSETPLDADEELVEDTVIYAPETPPPPARADSEPPPSRRSRADESHASPNALLRTSSDIGPQKLADEARRAITFLPAHGYQHGSLELRAPEPAVGCGAVAAEDLVTRGLAKLAADLSIAKRFRPAAATRELRPFERGFWRVACADWAPELRAETWAFLANYVGSGAAGWGVSCRRDEPFAALRVYCWGAVAAHIYLLVYLASRRRVLFTGAEWVDGDGETVITMGKRAGVWRRA